MATVNTTLADYGTYLTYYGHTYRNNDQSFTVKLGQTKSMFLFYRSYQPNILWINKQGEVAVVAGQNQSITVTASNDEVTIKNTIGWGLGFFWVICG